MYNGIRKSGLTALFILLNELDEQGDLKSDSTLSREEFQPIFKKIKQLYALEKVLIEYLEPLQSHKNQKQLSCLLQGRSEDNRTIYPKKKIESSNQYYHWLDTFINIKYCNYEKPSLPQEIKNITQHKYHLAESPARTALIRSLIYKGDRSNTVMYAKTSNDIQTRPLDDRNQTAVIDKTVYFSRDLFHLRESPIHQIALTLDYFSNNEAIGKLHDPNIQDYVEANLFEPGLLLAALKDEPDFLTRFDAFIEKGLRHFAGEDGLLTPESLFFIRLKMNVHRYAALDEMVATMNKANNTDKNTAFQLLQNNQNDLNKLIAVERDPAVLASLHNCRFLNAVTIHTTGFEQGISQENILTQALFSNAYQQATYGPFIPTDTSSLFEQQRAIVQLTDWLQGTDPAFIQTLITPLINQLGLDVSHLTLTGTYPTFQFKDQSGISIYTFNTDQGRVFQDNYSFSGIPLDIKRHSILQRLGLQHETSCWISEDGNLIKLNAVDVRIKREKDALIVQKKWNNQWYQLTALNDQQQALFGLDTSMVPKNKVEAILADASSEAWVNENHVLIVQNGRPAYQVDAFGVFHQLTSDDTFIHPARKTHALNGCILTKTPSAHEKVVTQFENPDFFTVNLDEATQTKGTINFARYGLTLAIADNKITLPNTPYALTNTDVFKSNVAALTFTNGKDEKCIIAVQPFYVDKTTPQEPGKYYALTHDTSGFIPNAILANEHPKKKIPLWNHHDAQRTITYKIVNGQPKPDTAADALYFCYIYLATHETDKAWMILNDLSKRLSLEGSKDELLYLSWIVNALPTILDTEKDSECTFETPEYVTCQLKALALYTDFLKLGKAPDLPAHPDVTYANGFYEEHCRKNLSLLEARLESTIEKLYSKYQRQERHLSEKYTLQDQECSTLLNYCSNTQHGALGYEKRRLSLKTLLNEYQRLIAAKNTAPEFAKRIATIEKQITHELKVMKKQTQLVWVELDLEFHDPMDMMYNQNPIILNEINTKSMSPAAETSFEK